MKNKYFFSILWLIFGQTIFGQNDADIDSSFNIGNGFNGTIYAIAIQSDGKNINWGIIYNL